METLLLWLLVIGFAGAFAAQVAPRVRLIASAPNTFSTADTGARLSRFLIDVVAQRKTIVERPWAGLAHAFVFWGFIAFGGYTGIEFLAGLGIADLTHTGAFAFYRAALTPFAVAVLCGIVFLMIRRGIVRPVALGTHVSAESILIGLFITTLMVTFLLTWRLDEASTLGRLNWWLHSVVILAFMALIPASKHFHLVLSPLTVFLKSPELGNIPNLDFEKEQVGLETLKDMGSKTVLDAFTCVECGRCQVNCPAWAAGKELNPKAIILQTQAALLGKPGETKLVDLYTDKVLWQCTTCGACENQCPVGIEHLPLLIGARRGLVSNGEAPAYLGAMYNNLERRSNIWGLSYDQRQKFVEAATLEIFDPRKHDVLVWLGCAGAFEADFQKSLRSMFEILRAKGVAFGVLSKERCTGDAAKRTGNEYMFQELATANIEDLKTASPRTILTSCPHCVKTIGEDYRKFGYTVNIVHSAVFIEELTRADVRGATGGRESVTYHDPCYLGRYAQTTDEPRALLERFGADIKEPERNRENPYCCGAGGGLLFEDTDAEPGTRISDVRFTQLRETGAGTVVTACPFCSIMLKGAQSSAPEANVQFVDLMTFVNSRLQKRPPQP
ncbi:MAG: (Fe-S)-binding protein [Vicinamibacterales bacterium]